MNIFSSASFSCFFLLFDFLLGRARGFRASTPRRRSRKEAKARRGRNLARQQIEAERRRQAEEEARKREEERKNSKKKKSANAKKTRRLVSEKKNDEERSRR